MAKIEIITNIKAPPQRCFDLSRDVDFHQRSLEGSQETAIAGRTSGLMELNDQVTWRAKYFGVYHLHTARITRLEPPVYFRDEMTRGRFKEFVHDHFFETLGSGTRMRDAIEFRSPLGALGSLVDLLVLRNYLRRLIEARSCAIRIEAESKGPLS